jgi:hypothetical protein
LAAPTQLRTSASAADVDHLRRILGFVVAGGLILAFAASDSRNIL